MPRLVVDAGPLIAVFHRQDTQHHYCVERLEFLIEHQYSLITTLPVLCEVHKLIQRYASAITAQKALFELWEALDIQTLEDTGIQDAITLVVATPGWQGTLQDASIVVTARCLNIEVWTLDYRDFSRFQDLKLWN
ncbi:type II toxin-antitoxin system VapC family toxin [Acaryochloris marina]|uniref:PIN domain-containing protein n=1 Tax=Acaryochloris marina (strain MBIC 11017) TaxID=329726 RepID=B0CEA1_ACAM1|nr:PIN domain-containing protein [Acaryochloris marina]ABW25735.1 conserved hypothetical protein [Acaryochloris marina MBIC11017]BDM80602.1 twitching motility protein PilT [Acaryochloris marina MBIC10699]